MSRLIPSAVAAVGVIVLAALAVPALAVRGGATYKNVHFTETLVGGSISKPQEVYKVYDSVMGNGAAVQTVTTLTSKGGRDTDVTYFGDAKAFAKDTFTFGKANSKGILPLTGGGHDIGGTGALKGLHSSYTFTGTYDPATKIAHVKLTGTESYQ